MIYGKFTPYQPQDGLAGGLYLRDEQGNDWYDVLKTLSETRWKLAIDADGVVLSAARDASYLVPVDMWVVEVDVLPDGFYLREWAWQDDALVRCDETAQENAP